MEGLNLQSLLKDNNKILLDFLKNEFVYIVKDGIVKDIKMEIYNMIFKNDIAKSKSKTCGFIRTRKRGTCKRLTNYLLCPYHLKKLKKEHENILLPDKIPSGKLSGSEDITTKITEESNSVKLDININSSYYDEIKILENIDPDIFNYEIIMNIKNTMEIKNNINSENIKKKKKKNKIKKVIKIYDNININDIKNKIEITLHTFKAKVPKDEVAAALHILFDENKQLFKKHVNIILSNIDIFFKDINTDILNKIWKNVIEYIPYENVLIYDNNNDNIIEKVFGYIRNNYLDIPKEVKILWIDHDKNIIIQYNKKYKIENYKTGISIYSNNDVKKQNPLPLDKLTLLYY